MKKKKKICFITTVHGTLRSFVLVTAEYLYNSGEYDITFISNGDDEFSQSLPNYINYIQIPMRRGIDKNIFKIIKTMSKYFKDNNYDIIQYATPNAALYGAIAARISKTPVRIYGQWGLRYLTMRHIDRVVFKSLEYIVSYLSTDIHVTSHKNKDFGVKQRFYKEEKATVLGEGGATGIDLSLFDVKKRKENSIIKRKEHNLGKSFIFGFVGRITKDKGINELLGAIKELEENYDVKLICIGNIEKENEIDKQLLEWARKSDSVIFLNRIKNEELPEYYSVIDSYVHPSYREGYSKVIQEAASMGCAIITTDIPGASEIMIPDESCLLVPPNNLGQLIDSMERLLINDLLREGLQKKAVERAHSSFNRIEKLKIQKEFYDSLI